MKHIYLRFLSLAHALRPSLTGKTHLDEMSKRLLEIIAVRFGQGTPMTVTDAMSQLALASPATLHRKLDDLREAGLIEQIFEGQNRRTKYLVPTPTANLYLDKLGQAMCDAVAHAQPAAAAVC
jgi:DNA-binding MarR family transcriptional regulator